MTMQLRITPKPDDTGFYWQVVTLAKDSAVEEVMALGEFQDIDTALIRGKDELMAALGRPVGPVVHEWDCTCGSPIHIEARQSRDEHVWVCPQEVTCYCGHVYGLKTTFTPGETRPTLSHQFRRHAP